MHCSGTDINEEKIVSIYDHLTMSIIFIYNFIIFSVYTPCPFLLFIYFFIFIYLFSLCHDLTFNVFIFFVNFTPQGISLFLYLLLLQHFALYVDFVQPFQREIIVSAQHLRFPQCFVLILRLETANSKDVR